MNKLRLFFLILLSSPPLPASAEPIPPFKERWLYVSTNLLVDANIPPTLSLIERAKSAGYTAIQLNDYKFNFLERMPDRYFRNVEKVKEAAASAGLDIIPSCFPIGYSGGLLSHDPNLAEGLPAESFLVHHNGQWVVEPRPAEPLQNGSLEATTGPNSHQFLGFSTDEPGLVMRPDRHTHRPGGQTSCRIELDAPGRKHPNARLIQGVTLRPRACYRLSAWVKTDSFSPLGSFRLLALGGNGGHPLSFHEGGIEPTQDWKQVEVVFNTLDQSRVNIYAGVWGPGSGTLWIDDLELVEVPLVNLLRRPGCPLLVTSEDGGQTFHEGVDFEPLVDPKLGQIPYAGEFEFGHPGPTFTPTPNSRISPSTRLKIHWYHPIITHGFQVACCLSEPKVYEILEDQTRRVLALFQPRTLFMSHDELRVANWCRACQDRGLTAGQLLADNAKRCVEIARKIDPSIRLVVWSDMFDPFHNAQSDYYLVRDSLEGSWEGLPPDVLLANWNSGNARQSLDFFARRGHSQVIAGYYDADNLDNFRHWLDSARGIPRVDGFMYTTWSNRYALLEAYGKAASTPPSPPTP